MLIRDNKLSDYERALQVLIDIDKSTDLRYQISGPIGVLQKALVSIRQEAQMARQLERYQTQYSIQTGTYLNKVYPTVDELMRDMNQVLPNCEILKTIRVEYQAMSSKLNPKERDNITRLLYNPERAPEAKRLWEQYKQKYPKA